MAALTETSRNREGGSPDLATALAVFVRRYAVFLLLAVLVTVFSIAEPAFLGLNNFMSVLQAVSVVAILAVGVTISMAVGGFDLSAGAVAASSVMAASYAMVVWRLDAAETVALVLTIGFAIGLFNAFLIVKAGVPDLLATLAVNFLLTGLQLIPTAGRSIATGLILPSGVSANGVFDPGFSCDRTPPSLDLAPLPVFLMIAVAVVAFVLTERTRDRSPPVRGRRQRNRGAPRRRVDRAAEDACLLPIGDARRERAASIVAARVGTRRCVLGRFAPPRLASQPP